MAPDAELAPDAQVGPFAVIGPRARIATGAQIGSQAVIGAECDIGAGAVIEPHAVLYSRVRLGAGTVVRSGACLGADGFGFAFEEGRFVKIPQVGTCVIGERVELGANSAVDRGSIGDTVLGDECRLASLVHIGHNAVLGERVQLGYQSGVAGSAIVGSRVRIGRQCAVVGHLVVGEGVELEDWSGITRATGSGEVIAGVNGRPRREARRADRILARLPRIVRRLRALEQAVRGPLFPAPQSPAPTKGPA